MWLLGECSRETNQVVGAVRTEKGKKPRKGVISGDVSAPARSHGKLWRINYTAGCFPILRQMSWASVPLAQKWWVRVRRVVNSQHIQVRWFQEPQRSPPKASCASYEQQSTQAGTWVHRSIRGRQKDLGRTPPVSATDAKAQRCINSPALRPRRAGTEVVGPSVPGFLTLRCFPPAPHIIPFLVCGLSLVLILQTAPGWRHQGWLSENCSPCCSPPAQGPTGEQGRFPLNLLLCHTSLPTDGL